MRPIRYGEIRHDIQGPSLAFSGCHHVGDGPKPHRHRSLDRKAAAPGVLRLFFPAELELCHTEKSQQLGILRMPFQQSLIHGGRLGNLSTLMQDGGMQMAHGLLFHFSSRLPENWALGLL